MVARLGGDEFGVLMLGLPPEAAGVIAEAVRERVEGLAWAGMPVPVTLSIGLASAQGPGIDVPGLLRTADRMLYRAKTTRNAVVADLAPRPVAASHGPWVLQGLRGRDLGVHPQQDDAARSPRQPPVSDSPQ